MTINEHKKDGYITLKEAGERFGYSADYIGQLIRKGKIDGKQVYANVAWMTTEEAMEEYLLREKNKDKEKNKDDQKTTESLVAEAKMRNSRFDRVVEPLETVTSHIFLERMNTIYHRLLLSLLIILTLCAIFLLYMFSVSIDRSLKWRSPVTAVKLDTTHDHGQQ